MVDKRLVKEKKKLIDFFEKNGLNAADFDFEIAHIAVQRLKLNDAVKEIGKDGVVIEYDNGGGQKGTRENPAFKGYESLWKTYQSALTMLLNRIPAEQQPQAKKQMNTLELIKLRRAE